MFVSPSSAWRGSLPRRVTSSPVSRAVPAMKCGASSETSQPPNIAGTLTAIPGAGRMALATRAEVISWRRRYDMPRSLDGSGINENVFHFRG